MRKALQFISRTLCLLAVAVGTLVLALAACFICMMGIIQMNEGRLMPGEKQALEKVAVWFLSSCVIVGVGWWLSRRVGGKDDDSFRLVRSTTGRSEKLAEPVSQLLFFIASALWLWAIIPGSVATKIVTMIGWLLVGYFGLHVRICLHELAHLGAAGLLGFHLQKIQIGDGPSVGSFCLRNRLRCELRFWPHGGVVFAAHRTVRHFTRNQIAFVAAGPLMDALLLWVAYRLICEGFGGLGSAFVHGPGGLTAAALFCLTAMSAARGLMPHRVRLAGDNRPTDGYLLLQLLVPRLKTTRLRFPSDSARALELLQSSSSQETFAVDSNPAEPGDPPAASPAFREQRDRLASRLLPDVGSNA
jgi:hypothetical protein